MTNPETSKPENLYADFEVGKQTNLENYLKFVRDMLGLIGLDEHEEEARLSRLNNLEMKLFSKNIQAGTAKEQEIIDEIDELLNPQEQANELELETQSETVKNEWGDIIADYRLARSRIFGMARDENEALDKIKELQQLMKDLFSRPADSAAEDEIRQQIRDFTKPQSELTDQPA